MRVRIDGSVEQACARAVLSLPSHFDRRCGHSFGGKGHARNTGGCGPMRPHAFA